MQISSVPEAASFHLWPAVEQILAPAADFEDVFDPASDVLWIAYDRGVIFGAATTRLMADGEAELRLIGGTRFREWIAPLDEAVCGWARACGSPRLTARGRKGWARFNRAFGWVAHAVDDEGKIEFSKGL